MTDTKHTPGPWTYAPWGDGSSPEGCVNIYAPDSEVTIAEDVLKQEAPLLAAAPETAAERDRLKAVNAELLGLLKEAYDNLEDNEYEPMNVDLYNRIRRGITKAESSQ